MDVEGLDRAARAHRARGGRVLCRDAREPVAAQRKRSWAKPYAFLDDAPAEERRTLAVQARRYMSVEQAAELGKLDHDAIERVRAEAWPDVGNPDGFTMRS